MRMRLQSGIAILVLIGALGYGYSKRDTLSQTLGFGTSKNNLALSKIGIIEGDARIRKNNEMGSVRLEEKKNIFSGDRIETSSQSSVDVEIGTGGLIKVMENSRILFERDEKSIPPLTRVEVIEGQVQTIVKPAETNIVLVEGGTATNLAEHAHMPVEKIDPNSAGQTPTAPTKPTAPQSGVPQSSGGTAQGSGSTAQGADTLPDDYIESTVRNQKSLLSRCFAEHLRTNTKTQGRVDLSFLIERSGTVGQVRVIGSTIADDKFKSCLVQVIERVQFRKFNADPILVNYPLSFE
ncbi:MAG: AgmX/PglI C-terminal domain-containing protein [Bdellovibrionales bacterium]|nr:AgmX/PglI C-terminal domain-containing protein [Bdellovibrionales bacterium]